MKTSDKKTEQQSVKVRRYSDHPAVQKKLAQARSVFEKIDMSFLTEPPQKD